MYLYFDFAEVFRKKYISSYVNKVSHNLFVFHQMTLYNNNVKTCANIGQ